jgi:tetratricopeptide (TPR) repeat protein
MFLLDREDDRALGELEIARAGLPNSPALFRMLSLIERRRGNWAAALSALTRGFEIEPGTFSEYLAPHYLFQRDYPEAFRFIEIARTANRAAIAVPHAWALFCAHQDIAGARRVLEPVLTQGSPPDARALGLLARLEFIDGRYDRALEIIQDMDAAGAWLPPDFRFPSALAEAQVYEAMNRRAEAIERYRAAADALEARRRDTPNDHQVEAALGLAYAGLGRPADAVSHGELAVALVPIARDAWEGPLYVYLLAQIYARLGRHADAFARLDELFKVPGFYNVTWVERDPGFASLRAQSHYRDHVTRWSAPIRIQSND